MIRRPTVILLTTLLATGACRSGGASGTAMADSTELARRSTRLATALAEPDSGAARTEAVARWVLPKSLAEISGLALTADGRLLVHDDEAGRISEIDYRRGVVVKQFTLGKPPVKGDFEGLAIADDSLYLLASNGRLYAFREGEEGEQVEYNVDDTHLGHECEFEGVAFDPTLHALLLACKRINPGGPRGDSLVIYRWPLPFRGDSAPSRLTVSMALVVGANGWKALHPSDITLDPASGNYVLVSAEEQALVELTPEGAVVVSRPLPGSLAHTEGVAITPDSILILSDEAGKQPAAITLYRWR